LTEVESFMADESETARLVSPGSVDGSVRVWLRVEGLAVLAAAIFIYVRSGHSWILLVVLFLAPDLSFFGYAMGPRIGAVSYNVFHSYIFPLALAGGLWLAGDSMAVALIWIAHIGFDRLLGYGLKYPSGFGDTHLGRLGRPAVESEIR